MIYRHLLEQILVSRLGLGINISDWCVVLIASVVTGPTDNCSLSFTADKQAFCCCQFRNEKDTS